MASTSTKSALEERLGYRFADPDLLQVALSHRSWCSENIGRPSNERLEFLGDAVLGLVVTDSLYARFPGHPEGQLAKTRATVVSSATLTEVGLGLGLGNDLRLGKGEEASGGRNKPSILADAVEAVIGAVYLDGGVSAARTLVLGLLDQRIEDAATRPGARDYKTRLQEIAAADGQRPPVYVITESGPDHHKRFMASVSIGEEVQGTGDGSSKKEAEQQAARAAWETRGAKDGVFDV